jgi:hypothetical protein
MYQCLGSIEISLDGELRYEVDIGQRLVALTYGSDRPWSYWKGWRKENYRIRQQNGLPVPEWKEDYELEEP